MVEVQVRPAVPFQLQFKGVIHNNVTTSGAIAVGNVTVSWAGACSHRSSGLEAGKIGQPTPQSAHTSRKYLL